MYCARDLCKWELFEVHELWKLYVCEYEHGHTELREDDRPPRH